MYEFDSEEEYLHWLRVHLSSFGMAPEIAGPLAVEISDVFTMWATPKVPSKAMGLVLTRTYWVIRDDDLRLIESLCAAVLAAASVDFFHKSPTASAVTGVLAAAFKLIHSARAKGVRLTPFQHSLMLALKASDQSSSIPELTLRMNEMSPLPREQVWAEKDLLNELSKLTKIRLADGSVVALVAQDSDGLWSTCGL